MGKVKEATEKKEGQLISSDPLACIAYNQNRAIGVLVQPEQSYSSAGTTRTEL